MQPEESSPPTGTHLGYLPVLDGLRALAVVMVVGCHVDGTEHEILRFGMLGVDVFFVLSGFLITALIAEQIRSGQFSRRRFYARRAIRLVPALLTVVVVFTPVAAMVVTGQPTWLGAAAALLYLSPFVSSTTFGHTWTLAMEEWFYLLWPIVLAKFFRDRLTLRQCAVLIGALGVFSQAAMIIAPGSIAARPSGLFLGCALALWWLDGGRLSQPAVALVAGVAAILVGGIVGHVLPTAMPFWLAVGGSMLAIGAVASGAGGPIAMLLEARPMIAVGVVSYEWYLLHFPMLQVSEELWGFAASLLSVPVSLAAAFALHRALAPIQARLRRPLRDDRAVVPPTEETV